MSLLDILRTGVAIANSVTKPIQATVILRHTVSSNSSGDVNLGDPVSLRAVVDWKQKHLRTASGELSVSRASVAFLDIAELNRATNGEGLSDTDSITLPDGTTGPILDMAGFIDAGTGHPLATTAFLG